MTIVDARTPDPKRLVPGATGDWEVIVGMEVHAQVTSNAKLFSGASTAFGAEPNANVSLVDAAMPGMLPVINEECVKQAIRTGLGLKAQINLKSVFEAEIRKHPQIVDCWLMTGENDYLLRILARDLKEYETFLTGVFTKVPGIASIQSSVSLRRVKAAQPRVP